MAPRDPTLIRALLVPWSLASILFVGISSVLLALFLSSGSVFGWVGSYFLLSWLFKYAYVLLERVANGTLEAPPVSVEMLGPFEQRPMIQIAWCIIVYLAVRTLGSAGTLIATCLLALLPASIAALGLELGALQSVNPLTLWRILRGLGWHYLAVLGLIAAAAGLILLLARTGAWSFWLVAAAELAVLTVFSALGGALFERRLEIGHEPVTSPERQREKESREHAREVGAMLDDVYTGIRIKRYDSALQALRQWLASTRDTHMTADVYTIIDRVAEWRDPHALSLVTQTLVTELTNQGQPDLARKARQHASQHRVPESPAQKPETR